MSTYTIAVQGYDLVNYGDALIWDESAPQEIDEAAARKHLADLTRRRRSLNLVKLTNGIEFDTYKPNGVPPGCPELAGSRTRVTFEF